MSENVKNLFDERLGRYQATIALEPTDRIPMGDAGKHGLCLVVEVDVLRFNQ